MGNRSTLCNKQYAVNKYVGTAYDTVKKVSYNIDDVKTVADALGDDFPENGLDTLVENIDEVVLVAENLDDVKTTADNILEVVEVADNIDAVLDAPNQAQIATEQAVIATEAADSIGRYKGLWPDTGGSALKGDTYQTQVSGTPTGQYFTALQDTTVDPVGDDVNWRAVISSDLGSVNNGTKLQHRRGTNAEILAGTPAIGELWFNTTDSSIHMGDGVTQGGVPTPKKKQSVITFGSLSDMKQAKLTLDQEVETKGYYESGDGGHATYVIVPASTGTADDGLYVDLNVGLQAQQVTYGDPQSATYGVVKNESSPETKSSNKDTIESMVSSGQRLIKLNKAQYYLDPTDLSNVSAIDIQGEGQTKTSIWFDQQGLTVGNTLGSTNSAIKIKDAALFGISGVPYSTEYLIRQGANVLKGECSNLRMANAQTLIDSEVSSFNWNKKYSNIEMFNFNKGIVTKESNATSFYDIAGYNFDGTALEFTGFGNSIVGFSAEGNDSLTEPSFIARARGLGMIGSYFENNNIAQFFEGQSSGGFGLGRGVFLGGGYYTGGSKSATAKHIDLKGHRGVAIGGNYFRNADKGVESSNGGGNIFLFANEYESVSAPVTGRGISELHYGRLTLDSYNGGNDVGINGKTRNNLASSMLEGRFTTLDNLLDVRLNDSVYEWRTWIGGRDGADGGARPTRDNSQNFGSASNRWAEFFAGNGTINTSDEREKTFDDITEAETACARDVKKAIRKFKWNDAIEEKGVDSARIHFGVGAQTIADIFTSHGLNHDDYSLFCYDEWDDVEVIVPESIDDAGNIVEEHVKVIREAGNRYGIRYTELLCFIISAM